MLGASAMLIEALKCNSSLWQVTTDLSEEELSEADKTKMTFYAKRNKQIHAIMAAPRQTLPTLLMIWPRIFLGVRGCEMEASILLVALAALEEAVGPQSLRENGNECVAIKAIMSRKDIYRGGPGCIYCCPVA